MMIDFASLRTVIAAVDLEDGSEPVVAYAGWLAGIAGPIPCRLLHVMAFALTPPAYLQPYLAEERRKNADALSVWTGKLAAAGVTASAEVDLGRVVETLSGAARNAPGSLLVTGYRGHRFRSSRSERLIAAMPAPLFVVRGSKSKDARVGTVTPRKILCPIDFSAASAAAFDWSRDIALKSGAALEVLHVIVNPYIQEPTSYREEAPEEHARYRDAVLTEVNERFSRFTRNIPAGHRIVTGNPFTSITEFAAANDTDLIVIGARGLGRIEGVMLGSVAASVIKSSPCPVLVVSDQ
jgi:nucleotide-binding universal stress UspA family protein